MMAVFMGAAFSPLGAVLCLLTTLFLYIFYRLFYAPYHVHKQYSIKGPRPEPFWGSYSDVKKMKLNSFLEEGQRKYGSFFGFYIGSKYNVVVCDIRLIEDIMTHHHDKLSCGGPYTAWSELLTGSLGVPCGLSLASGTQLAASRAALISTQQKVKQLVPAVSEGCARLVQSMDQISEAQECVDVHKLYLKFSLETIVATAFGDSVQTGEQGSDNVITATNEFVNAFLESVSNRAEESTLILSHLPLVRPLLVRLAAHSPASEAHRRLTEAVTRLVEARRGHTSPPQDMLQLLLDTTLGDDEDADGNCDTLTDHQIVGHAVDFLVSGYETTASVLSYVSYQLALHTSIQSQVHEEIDAYFKRRSKKSLYDASQRLSYLDSVIQETMRIFPPIPTLFRHCEADIELERRTVPKGADLYIPTFLVHKNPDLWPQPHRFKPARFSNDEKVKRSEMAHMPFGTGPHACIGNKFAMALIKMALISMLRHYTFVTSPNTEVPLKIRQGIVNVPRNGVLLHITPRTSTTTD